MLSKINKEEFYQYLNFAYELALDPQKSGYPIYADKIKTKEDFVEISKKGLERYDDEILLFRQDGCVQGWIHYFREPGECYLQTCVFNINQGTAAAVGEFLDYIKEKFPGYHAYLGFPGENQEAAEALLSQGFVCNEESFNNSFFFDAYDILPEQGDIRSIDTENYQDFRILHAPYDEEMYWDSDHILADLAHWNINVYYKNQLPAGAVYFCTGGPMLEIFGLDYPDDIFDETVCRGLLTRALNEGKKSGARYMTFFCDERHRNAALELGFQCVGKYMCFDKIL